MLQKTAAHSTTHQSADQFADQSADQSADQVADQSKNSPQEIPYKSSCHRTPQKCGTTGSPLPSPRASTATYECRRLFLTIYLHNFHLMQTKTPQSNGPKVREPYRKDCLKAEVLEFTPPG
jgi:hypothetical protein